MLKLLQTTLCLALVLSLAACAVTEAHAPTATALPTTEAATTTAAVTPPLPVEYNSFTEDQLYQAIISELGAQRGGIEDAGEGYFDLAFSTRDLGVIQRAVQFAAANNDLNALLQLGLLWAEVAPEDPQPHLLLSFQFLENGNFDQALSHMARVIDLGGNIDFSALSERAGRLSPEERNALISNLRQLALRYPQQASIQLTLVRLLAQNQQFDAALAELQLAKQRLPIDGVMFLLEAQLLQSLNNTELALRTLRNGVRTYPENTELRLNYARLLIQQDNYRAAQEQFRQLMAQNPQDWETLYSIALLDLEMENYDSAIQSLERLIGVDQRVDESQFYLGFIYEQQDDSLRAIEHYRQVRSGSNNFLPAQQQATRHSIELGELQDAHDWLSRLSRGQPRLEVLLTTIEASVLQQFGHGDAAKALLDSALNRFPNDADLLFQRVLYFDGAGDRRSSENDLRQIILMQPEDSRALNHLGYMLADQSTRYEEALELLQRAIAIAPDDPAIIDSLAWVQYKLGIYEEALGNLRRAFAVFPDHEVASHLGEVLWVMGRREEATQVWQDALRERPDSPIIKEAMERLQSS